MKRTLAVLLGACAFVALTFPLRGENRQFLVYEDFTDFLTAVIPPDWTVEDANADGFTWEAVEWGGARGGPSARYLAGPDAPADDWLILPLLPLEPGVEYKVEFHVRVTDPNLPHSLDVVVGTSAATGETAASFPSISNSDPERYEATFTVLDADDYHVQFHTTSPAGSLGLFLSRVIVSEPEEDLTAVLQLDANVYHPDEPNVFDGDEEIRLLVFVQNDGADPVTLNGRLAVGPEDAPDTVLAYRIVGPDGTMIPFEARVATAAPLPDDFRDTEPGAFAFKFDDLNNGVFDLSEPGDYTVQAVYRNVHLPETGTAWRGILVSEPSTFTVE